MIYGEPWIVIFFHYTFGDSISFLIDLRLVIGALDQIHSLEALRHLATWQGLRRGLLHRGWSIWRRRSLRFCREISQLRTKQLLGFSISGMLGFLLFSDIICYIEIYLYYLCISGSYMMMIISRVCNNCNVVWYLCFLGIIWCIGILYPNLLGISHSTFALWYICCKKCNQEGMHNEIGRIRGWTKQNG